MRIADDNEESFDPSAIDTLGHNLYADDLLKSVPTLEKAITLMEKLIELCAKGRFNLTKFVVRQLWF